MEKQSIEIEKNKAELALYRAQINPHFLFNTLNTLYGLIINKSNKAENVLVKITDILHYMYNDASKEKIPLENEFVYIKDYIDLQKFRLPSNVQVDYNNSYDNGSILIAPMILITFIENTFKYGISVKEDCLIKINIEVRNDELIFESINKNYKSLNVENKGIGIDNCKKRLKSIYPNNYKLDIREENQMYYVKLQLKLIN
ncbi:MAG: sensor histidine kinase [Bacteroidales bacterium]